MGLQKHVPNPPSEADAAEEPTALRLPTVPAGDAIGRRSLSAHLDYVLNLVQPLEPFGINLIDAWGHTLCEDIFGDGDVPDVPVVEVDGYAFAFQSITATPPGYRPALALTGMPRRAVAVSPEPAEPKKSRSKTKKSVPATPTTAPPETVEVSSLGLGQTVLVQAGEALPFGADTVVARNQVEVDSIGSTVIINTSLAPGDWVRAVGSEAQDGQLLMPQGTVLDDRSSAILAAAGFERVLVRPRTRVAIAQVLDSAVESNFAGRRISNLGTYLMNGAARADGATVWRFEIDLAQPVISRERLNDELIRADLVLIIGGLTDDGVDHRLAELMASMGVVDIAEVTMSPGRWHGFGIIGDDRTPTVVLPDDPTALLVAYHCFARPVLRKLTGAEPLTHEPVLCYTEHDFESDGGITQLVPCRVRQKGDRYLASEIAPRRHSLLPTLVAADALVLLPADRDRILKGQPVPCWLLGDKIPVNAG